jgi:outer membrane protein insertion porin family
MTTRQFGVTGVSRDGTRLVSFPPGGSIMRRPRTFVHRWLAAVALAAAASAACHDEGDIQVNSLKFVGNRVFKSSRLGEVTVTRATGRMPWARPRYFNRAVFEEDQDRLRAFYTDRGYPDAHVTSVDVTFNEKRDAVDLRIHLDEGTPLVVERVAFTGLEQAPPDLKAALESVPLRAGLPRDRAFLAATRERVTFLLHDYGYPRGRVESHETAGSQPKTVVVTIEATMGEPATFGDVSVVGLTSVHEALVFRTLAFKPGDMYRESQVMESQRRLAKLGIFEFAHVRNDPQAERAAAATRVPMVVTLSEGRPTRLQLGAGYGTEDGPRGSIRWEHLNFLGDARRFAADGRYSTRLRGAGVEFVEPYFLTPKVSFTANVGGWWTDEPTYTSRTYGGRLGLAYRHGSARGLDLEPIDHILRLGYANESLRYSIDPETLDDLDQIQQFIALGLDPVTGQGDGRLASIDIGLERTAIDEKADPHSGHGVLVRLKHAAPWLGGTYRFDEIVTEGKLFVPFGDRNVWATRIRVGAILADELAPVPISERYFLGGSTSLRGWGRYEVAPLTTDGLPVGGRGVLDTSSEWRMVLRGNWGAALFVDAGNVWEAAEGLGAGRIRVDVGPGLRWLSPLGIVRVDLGIQLTPIDGLQVDGKPETRHWRLHFSIGHPF